MTEGPLYDFVAGAEEAQLALYERHRRLSSKCGVWTDINNFGIADLFIADHGR
jgi:hypothetical protein